MNANEQLIASLTDSQEYQNYERAYIEATGLPLTLRPLAMRRLPLHGKRKENPFCALMAEKSRTCAACLQVQEQLAQSAMHEPATTTCAYGLCETAVPVKLGQRTIGILQTGQALRKKPTAASFRRAVEHAKEHGVDLRPNEAREAYFNTPVISQKKLDSVTNRLRTFAHALLNGRLAWCFD
jgi:ligand-binding sensor protein